VITDSEIYYYWLI